MCGCVVCVRCEMCVCVCVVCGQQDEVFVAVHEGTCVGVCEVWVCEVWSVCVRCGVWVGVKID